MMRRRGKSKMTMAVAAVAGFLSLGAAPDLTAEQWRADLKTLAEGIVNTHDNAFHTMTEGEFNLAVKELNSGIPGMEPQRIVLEMARLVAMVGDGHTRLGGWLGNQDYGFRWYPIQVYWFPDGLYVLQAHPRYADMAGGRVVRIGNMTVEEAFQRVQPYVAADNENGKKAWSPAYLTCPEILYHLGVIEDMDEPAFVIEKDGRMQTVHLKPMEGARPRYAFGFVAPGQDWVEPGGQDRPTPLWLKGLGSNQRTEYLPEEKLFYVQHNQIRPNPGQRMDQVFADVFAEMESHDVERFVLDLRLNGGGNNYLNKPVITGIIAHPEINRPGHLYVIIGRRTFSAAQNLVNELEKYTEAIFVGEPTAERVNFYGDTRPVDLEHSGLTARISWLWWQNLDPRDERTATAPRLAVDLTMDDWMAGRDPVLETIIGYKLDDFAAQLRAQSLDSRREDVIAWTRKKADEPLYRYRNLEAEINIVGYQILGEERLEQAIRIFQANVALYPESWNVYDSLGEALAKAGKKDESRVMYERSLQLNPESPTGREALATLRED